MLTIEEARAKAEELLDATSSPANVIAFRSCWECNSSHEHLKRATDCIINCFSCGKFYFMGVDITVYEDEEA